MEHKETQQEGECKKTQIEAEEALGERKYVREHQREETHMKHEYKLKRLELKASSAVTRVAGAHDATPHLPPFSDGHDELDSYLQRFEQFMRSSAWKEDEWVTYLSALLTEKTLDTYSQLSDADARSYARLKSALLKRYNLTKEGLRRKFRKVRPKQNETPLQFVIRRGAI